MSYKIHVSTPYTNPCYIAFPLSFPPPLSLFDILFPFDGNTECFLQACAAIRQQQKSLQYFTKETIKCWDFSGAGTLVCSSVINYKYCFCLVSVLYIIIIVKQSFMSEVLGCKLYLADTGLFSSHIRAATQHYTLNLRPNKVAIIILYIRKIWRGIKSVNIYVRVHVCVLDMRVLEHNVDRGIANI